MNILQLPRKIFLFILSPIIFIYQKLISPLLGPRCRYHPSCSNYFVQAITTHGIFKGIILGTLRIIRCNPFSGGGFNPVPQKEIGLLMFTQMGHPGSSAKTDSVGRFKS